MPVTESPGPGVDAAGVPVRDPTANVLDKVVDAVKRLDDVAMLTREHNRDMSAQRLRYEDKLDVASKELALAESRRIDAIHAADEAAKAREALVNAAQQATLAKQVTDTAEAFRVQVENQRVTTAEALDARLLPISTTLAEIQKVMYAGQGEKVGTIDATALARDTAALVLAAQREAAGSTRNNTIAARTLFFAVCGLALAIITAAALIGTHL